MSKPIKNILRWLPAIFLMLAIFVFSSVPSNEMPSFGFLDTLVKKSGHALGYGVLSLSYWYGLRWEKRHRWMAILLVVLYALSDEFHQSFIPGRHSSLVDALVFDTGGGILSILLVSWLRKKK